LRASGKPVMLLFIAPDCSTCAHLLPDVSRWQKEYTGKLTVVLVSGGAPQENQNKVSEHDLTNLLLQENWEVARTYRLRGNPSAVVVNPDGTIGSPLVGGTKAIRALVAQAIQPIERVP
jgi:thiol-disulfide isomerase/thioredoxin